MIYIFYIYFEINTRMLIRAHKNNPMEPYNYMIFDDIKLIILRTLNGQIFTKIGG